MKELDIFRIFASFPLIGIFVPDVTTALQSSISAISTAHAIVDITLSVCVLICSIGIYYAESKGLKTA